MCHTRQEQSCYFWNCVKGSDGTWVTRAIVGTTLNVWSNHMEVKFLNQNFEIAIFWLNQPWISPKLWPRSKSMTPPKVGFLRPNRVFGGSKKFYGDPKNNKNLFSPKTWLPWFDRTLRVVPTMALDTQLPSDPLTMTQFKKEQLCTCLVWFVIAS